MRAAGDITVINDRLAFALAVQSPAPYGVPRGAIVDIAPVTGGTIGRDRVVFADFIPNNWSAWPNTYQRIAILEHGPHTARISAVRDWGKVRISTVYTLQEYSDRVEISTTMTNEGDAGSPDRSPVSRPGLAAAFSSRCPSGGVTEGSSQARSLSG
jgi:hypothetical protein